MGNTVDRRTQERRVKMATWLAQGVSITQIARRLGVTRQAIQRNLRNLKKAGGLTKQCSECGGPLKMPRRVKDRILCHKCLANNSLARFGQRLRGMRLAMGLTKNQLAVLSGVCDSAISEYERSERLPKPITLEQLRRALGKGLA